MANPRMARIYPYIDGEARHHLLEAFICSSIRYGRTVSWSNCRMVTQNSRKSREAYSRIGVAKGQAKAIILTKERNSRRNSTIVGTTNYKACDIAVFKEILQHDLMVSE